MHTLQRHFHLSRVDNLVLVKNVALSNRAAPYPSSVRRIVDGFNHTDTISKRGEYINTVRRQFGNGSSVSVQTRLSRQDHDLARRSGLVQETVGEAQRLTVMDIINPGRRAIGGGSGGGGYGNGGNEWAGPRIEEVEDDIPANLLRVGGQRRIGAGCSNGTRGFPNGFYEIGGVKYPL